MRKKIFLTLSCLVILMFNTIAFASPIKVLGIEGTGFGYTMNGALTNINFNSVSSSAFSTIDLNNYDVLYVGETFMDGGVSVSNNAVLTALYARRDDLASWLYAGHGIVALSEPIGLNPWGWVPDKIRPTVGGFNWSETVRITNNSHPVMAGITDSMLSNWGTSSHANFAGIGGLSLLADNGAGRPITLAGEYGLGRIVLTSQDPNFHRQGAPFLQNAINWTGTAPVPEPMSLSLLSLGLIGIAGFKTKKK